MLWPKRTYSERTPILPSIYAQRFGVTVSDAQYREQRRNVPCFAQKQSNQGRSRIQVRNGKEWSESEYVRSFDWLLFERVESEAKESAAIIERVRLRKWLECIE